MTLAALKSLSPIRVTVIGSLAGLLNGLIGIGGGIVIVPGLIRHRNASPEVAVGSSLAAVVVLSSVAFLVHVYLTGLGLDLSGLALVIASGAVGAQFGGWILARLSTRWMLMLFSAFVLLISARLLAQGLGFTLAQPTWRGAPATWAYPVVGLASGILSGVFGVGGGALVLLGFAVFFGMPIHQGLPLALAVNVTNALSGCVRHGFAGRVLWREVGRMVPAALVGIVMGCIVAVWLPPDELRVVFSGFFLFMAIRIGRQALRS